MTEERADGLARCVESVDAFLAEDFTCRPRLDHARPVGDLLTLDDVDAVLTGSGLRCPAIRVVRDGAVVDPATWTRRARTGSVWIDDLVHPGKVLDHFADGATIVLQSLHRWWPAVSEFCRALELDLGHAVQANAYLTPPGSTGFDPHHDTHDVFVLQLHGAKDWVIREPVIDAPLGRHTSDHDEAARQPVSFRTRLEPGDCLYLPRGHIHSARTEQGASLHLTVGVLATTAHDVLRRVLAAAADDPTFRRTMPASFGSDASVAEAATKQVIADFTRWLSELDPAPIAGAAIARFDRGRRPLLGGQLRQVLSLEEVDDEHRVALRSGTRWSLQTVDDRAVVTAGDRRIGLPAPLAPVLERLLDGSTHRVGDLADQLDDRSRLVLVRRLIRDGLLVTVES